MSRRPDLDLWAIIDRDTRGVAAGLATLALPTLDLEAAIESATRPVAVGLATLAGAPPPPGELAGGDHAGARDHASHHK